MKGMIDSPCGISFEGKSCLLWLVFPFMERSGIFWNFPVNDEFNIKLLATELSPSLLLQCYNQVAKIVTLIFRLFCLLQKTPTLDRNIKVTCGICGNSVTKKHLSRHKKSCSAGTLYCPKCPIFFTKSRDDLNYHIAKQHSAASPSKTYKCKFCHAEFPVNTKTLNMERKMGLERAILMWRT